MANGWIVHKFGGTSLAGAARYRSAARLVLDEADAGRAAVVVSAMAGVTDGLIAALDEARAGQDSGSRVQTLMQLHFDTARDLLPDEARRRIASALRTDGADLLDVLRGVRLVRSYSEQQLDLVSGYGELWSAQLLQAYFESQGIPASWLDARQVLIVGHGETGPAVDWNASNARLSSWLDTHAPVAAPLVITGYIAATSEGLPTTLKRNGSDFSASIFAALLQAREIIIWTDVDGVLSADPRRVPEAVVVPELSYDEAAELAYFGAKVLHPHTMAPAIAHGIPIWIRNALAPAAPGTRIHARTGTADARSAQPVSGLTCIDDVALINVQGTGMMGVPGVAHRLFGALREVGVSVILISQASSEHSICFAVPEAHAERAQKAIEHAFFAEIHNGQIQTIERSAACSILAAVGDSMVETPGVAAKFFSALGKAGVNVRAIAQGSSERNISAVVDRRDSTRALRATHAGFYLSEQTLSVGVIGAGLIGAAFLDQLARQAAVLHSQFRIDLRLRGLMNSRRMCLHEHGLPLESWRAALESSPTPADLQAFTDHLRAPHLPHAVVIDCTASAEVAGRYAGWLERGIHVVTPNKKANSGALSSYRTLRALGRQLNTHYLYEATVGAGLPVISTLRDLVQTGDRVLSIEGVLSGTLSYIFNSFTGEKPFSHVVREAQRLGYTEPDPRDDLSGLDVARKLIILAREMGLGLELEQIPVQSLVPAALQAFSSAREYLERLPEHDGEMRDWLARAREAGRVLRHVGVVDPEGTSRVELREYNATHPFAHLQQSDNMILFRTERYCDQPLVVQGPGAGPQVTAGGVFADLLRLAAYLGAPS